MHHHVQAKNKKSIAPQVAHNRIFSAKTDVSRFLTLSAIQLIAHFMTTYASLIGFKVVPRSKISASQTAHCLSGQDNQLIHPNSR